MNAFSGNLGDLALLLQGAPLGKPRAYSLRLARVYPLHLVLILAYLAVKAAGLTFAVEEVCTQGHRFSACDRFSLESFLKQIFLVSAWDWNPVATWNPVAWSISSEWFAYCAFPFIIPLILRARRLHAIAIGYTASYLDFAEKAELLQNLSRGA